MASSNCLSFQLFVDITDAPGVHAYIHAYASSIIVRLEGNSIVTLIYCNMLLKDAYDIGTRFYRSVRLIR